MVRKVYRVLDRTYTLLGMKGRYAIVFLACLGLGMLPAFIIGSAFGMLVGSGFLIVLMIVVYLVIMMAESFFSEREILRFIWSHRIKDYITVKPKQLYRQWK